MGKLTNLNPPTPIVDSDIPAAIARDAEVTAAINGHLAAADPHTQYLLQSEGDARYRQSAVALVDSDIPAAIARDAEVVVEINAHVAATDPHPGLWQRIVAGFLNLTGGQRLLRNNPPIANTSFFGGSNHLELATNNGSDPILAFHKGGISGTSLYHSGYGNNSLRIRNADGYDSALLHTINHLDASDPHPQYLLQSEADIRYRPYPEHYFVRASFPPANIGVNSTALGWNSIQPGFGISEFCNYAGSGAGDAFNFFRLPGSTNAVPTLSNRVARIDIAGGYIQTSDRRLKKSFSPSPGLEAILSLSPKKYQHFECLDFDSEQKKFNLGKNFIGKIGFIAQEVSSVIPEAVSPTGSDEELAGIDYSCIVACLVRAVQEQQAQINQLQSQIKSISKI